MQFDFHSFIDSLRKSKKKKEVVEKFEKYFPNMLTQSIFEQVWYKDYISTFKKTQQYQIPDELKEDFDWELLQRLVAGSFSSTILFGEKTEGLYEMEIDVKSGNQFVIKNVSELWGFQIKRLYEIYIEEQMNLQILIAEDEEEGKENEKNAILAQRKSRLLRWIRLTTRLQIKELNLL